MKNPNGWGSVHKLPGNRRRPWRVCVTSGWEIGEDGKAIQQRKVIGYFATREEGMIALAEYNADPYAIDNAITFAELYRKWSAEKFPTISESNVQGYKASYAVCAELYDMRFAEIRRNHLQHVADTCGKNYPTLRKLKVLFSQLYTYARQNDICEKDYSEFVDIAKHKPEDPESKHRVFTADEISMLWENADRSAYIAAILMMIYSGVRVSELLELKKESVHMAERYFDVKKSKTTAGVRKVPIAQKMLPLWERWMNSDSKYVIYNAAGNKYDYGTFKRTQFEKSLSQIGITDHLPHDTRHTCISMLAAAGVSKVLIQRIVGHRGQDVTDDVYTHFDVQQLVDAIDKI